MNYKHLLVLLCCPFLLIGSQEAMNLALKNYKQLYLSEKPTPIVKHMAYHNTEFALDGRLKDEQLLEQRNYFLNFIQKNVKGIAAYDSMKSFLGHYNRACKESLESDQKNPLFLNKNILTKIFFIFDRNNKMTKKNTVEALIHTIEDPSLLNNLIYKANILKYIYVIPLHETTNKHKTTNKSDIIERGFNFVVSASKKVINAFRTEENTISDTSEVASKNKPFIQKYLEKVSQVDKTNNVIYQHEKWGGKQFIKCMFQPYDYKKFPPYAMLCPPIHNKIFKILFYFKAWSKKNNVAFPKPVQILILNKWISYEHAQRTRDYLLAETTLLNSNYLDGKENFNETIKDTMLFIKNDLLAWFDDQVKNL